MTSIMAGRPGLAEIRPVPAAHSEEEQIAQFLAQTDPVDVLTAAGYLAGRDGNLIARELRKPQLRRALEHSVCYAAGPDPNGFYREDGEPDPAWRRRRAATIRDHCAVCPVRAACAELALRDEDTHGVRGGLTEEKLELRLKSERSRLEAARAEDTRIARTQAERIRAAADVQRLALMYLGSVPQDKRDANNAAVRAAVQRRNALVAAHRADAGWTEAA
jgi:hypothetical protein